MLQNFMKVAMRNFLRQKLYSLINVIGLSSGLVCSLFIYLWVKDEYSRDKFHVESEKIFQVMSNLQVNSNEILTWTITPGPLGQAIKDNLPEAEFVARTQSGGSQLLQYGEQAFLERGLFADPDFFKIFSFPIVKGKPSTNPLDITNISISESLAKKLFGNDDPIGKTVKLNKTRDCTVAAVFADVTPGSSIRFEYILPFEIFRINRGDGFDWGNFDHPLYVKLRDPSQAADVTKKIHDLKAKAGGDAAVSYFMQPFTDVYLYGKYENGVPVGGRIRYVQIFSVVAVFILVIACINFMNMATARASRRSKEVGIRKVVGAQRKSLIFQFISESMLISAASMVLAVAVVFILLPVFNTLVNKSIALSFGDPSFVISIVLIVIVTGLLAGSYPAFFLSGYEPAEVLKGSGIRLSASALRQGLVVFQFAITVVLIASSIVVYNQLNYIMNKDVGYQRESVITFFLRDKLYGQFNTFKDELQQLTFIASVARGDQSLVQINNQNGSVKWPGKPDNSSQMFRTVCVDYGYLETLGLKLTDGRFFTKEFNDTNNFVITQRAAEVMGLANPVGHKIEQWEIPGQIVGVVDDVNGRSLQEAIDPIVFFMRPKWAGSAFIRLDPATPENIAKVETIYRKYLPEYPFTYTFLDEDFAKLYNTEKVTGSLAVGFTVMAIIISALGLVGLAAYTAEKRRKEISIRKTLGASVTSIVSMISAEFIKLSLVAAVIGCPVAYYLMREFLAGYAYHTELRWTIFIVTAIAITLIAMLTVIIQVAKAAVANPVDSLRNE